MSLQLVEVRAYLDLVLRAAVQIYYDDAVLRRGLHIPDQPGAADGPVKYSITLNVARLKGDLRTEFGGDEKQNRPCVYFKVISLRHATFERVLLKLTFGD